MYRYYFSKLHNKTVCIFVDSSGVVKGESLCAPNTKWNDSINKQAAYNDCQRKKLQKNIEKLKKLKKYHQKRITIHTHKLQNIVKHKIDLEKMLESLYDRIF